MFNLLDETATRYPTHTAVLTPDRSCHYAQFHKAVYATAGRLKELGVIQGDVVALRLPQPSFEYVVLLLAIIQTRAIACPLASALPAEVVEMQLRQTGARWLVTSDSFTKNGIKTLFWKDVLRNEGPMIPEQAFSEDAPAVIIFTSGSSAEPKAATLSYRNLAHSAVLSNRNIPVLPGDRWLLSLPLHHVSGLGIVFRCLAGGGTVVLSPWNAMLDAQQVTHISLVPMQLHWFLEETARTQSLRHLKAVLLGGGAIAPSLIQRALEHEIRIITSYGLTEMASQVTTTHPGDSLETLLTSGMPLEPETVKLSDDGGILVRGNRLFLGYLESGVLSCPISDDGWFRTRDTGYFDETGCLVVTGRKDNMFVCGGENVQPEMIERCLVNVTGVDQVCVTSVADEEMGHIGVAFVRMREGELLKPELLRTALIKHLPTHHIPKHFLPWPKGIAEEGIKVARRQLATRAQQILDSNQNE